MKPTNKYVITDIGTFIKSGKLTYITPFIKNDVPYVSTNSEFIAMVADRLRLEYKAS